MSFDIGYNVFNTLEAIFWLISALILFVRIRYIPLAYRRNTLWGGLFFTLFGLSDIAEIIIGGIFAPNQLWLFAIKAGCVLAFIVLFIRYVQIRKREGV